MLLLTFRLFLSDSTIVLRSRHEEIGEDLMDMLLGMSDFNQFKEQMLEFREQIVEGTSSHALNMMAIGPTVTNLIVHTEDMEDGEERMDLMDGLCIKPLSPVGAANARSPGPPPFGNFPSMSGA